MKGDYELSGGENIWTYKKGSNGRIKFITKRASYCHCLFPLPLMRRLGRTIGLLSGSLTVIT
jgi:hypothetical protein